MGTPQQKTSRISLQKKLADLESGQVLIDGDLKMNCNATKWTLTVTKWT